MDAHELLDIIHCGETSRVQFKLMFDHPDKIAAEIISMSNSKGGIIIFGVDDKTGDVVGLDYAGLQTISNKLAAAANDLVKPQADITTEVVVVGQKKVLLAEVGEGTNKPYKDNNGAIWIKRGADKRRVTDNQEIARMFQQSGLVHMDEMTVPGTGANDLDKTKVTEYVERIFKKNPVDFNLPEETLYQNLDIVKNTRLTLGGLLFFAKEPQRHKPALCVKAVSFVGNSIGGITYRDSRDMVGTIPELYKESMLFFRQNLRHVQRGQNFNRPGILEISETALEELLQNALIHRDYSKNAPIRLMVFDNRVEITSPGCLPNSLTVEKIKMGNAAVRNNLLSSYASRLMNYKGFGSGVVRAMEEQPGIEFFNDEEGQQFTVKIPREPVH